MVKKELVRELSKRMGVPQEDTRKFVQVFQDILTDELRKGETLELLGFGMFSPWQQTERAARNPKTGVPCIIKPRVSVKFKPGKFLLDALNESDDQ